MYQQASSMKAVMPAVVQGTCALKELKKRPPRLGPSSVNGEEHTSRYLPSITWARELAALIRRR